MDAPENLIPRRDVPLPRHMAHLSRDKRGFVVPWFVQWVNDRPVFPAFDPDKYRRATRTDNRRCWVCGQPLGQVFVFVVGPMCVINRVTSEPPCHRDCATYSAIVCPFLANPHMGRVPEEKVPGGSIIPPGGVMDEGNPGVTALWPTREYRVMRTDTGPLIRFGQPAAPVSWWAHGRPATAQEAREGFDRGAAKLRRQAATEGADAVDEFEQLRAIALMTLPVPAAAA